MRNIISITIITLIANFTFAQTETAELKTAVDKFDQYYNEGTYQAIFSMFSNEMQQALPIDKTTGFLTGLKSQAGNITKREFIEYKNETVASYKTTFERAVFILNISIDSNSKINGLFVKPFIENDPSEFAYNNLPVQDGIITKKQSDLIFEKTKIFPNQTQISIAIIENGNIKFYGIKRVNDSIVTFDNHKSVFEIGSITKVFTSTLLSNFVIDKEIELDNQINDHIKVPLKNNTEISFKQLANHTSGLPRLPSNLNLALVNPENPYQEYSEEKLEEYLTEKLKLSQNPGEKYEYSNLGAGLLGYVLSKIENTSYENLLKTKIFSKYNMTSSTTNRNEIEDGLIKGLNEKGDEVPNWDFSALTGAGSILSTVEDLSKFAIAQFDNSNKELEMTRTKTFSINDNMDIGLGWHIIKNKSGTKWNWHNGGTGGYSSSMAIDMKNKNGIIILSNVSAFSKNMGNIDDLSFGLMRTLENK